MSTDYITVTSYQTVSEFHFENMHTYPSQTSRNPVNLSQNISVIILFFITIQAWIIVFINCGRQSPYQPKSTCLREDVSDRNQRRRAKVEAAKVFIKLPKEYFEFWAVQNIRVQLELQSCRLWLTTGPMHSCRCFHSAKTTEHSKVLHHVLFRAGDE